jgi:hypothetical protein
MNTIKKFLLKTFLFLWGRRKVLELLEGMVCVLIFAWHFGVWDHGVVRYRGYNMKAINWISLRVENYLSALQ